MITKTLKFQFILLLTLVNTSQIKAQIATGEWRDHLPYNTAHTVAICPDKIYCAAEHVMFYYDRTDHSMNRMSKSNGLSDTGIGYIAYSDEHESLIIGYSNGNIDIIKDDIIINIPDVKDKNIVTEKGIKHISIVEDTAYLSCEFGIIVLNIEKLEISDTYILGDNSSYIPINACFVYANNIFALTENGILKADKDDPFLSYYDQWKLDTTLHYYSEEFISATSFNNQLFVCNSLDTSDICIIQSYDGNAWNIAIDTLKKVKSISSAQNKLIAAHPYRTTTYNEELQMQDNIGVSISQHALIDDDGLIWTATSNKGLYRNFESMYPNSPTSDLVFEMAFNNDEILVAPGGYQITGVTTYNDAVIQSFKDEQWAVLDKTTDPVLDSIKALVCFGVQEGNSSRYFVGSWGYGLLEVENGEVTNHYLPENTDDILDSFISGITFDDDGNLWLINHISEYPVVVKTPDNKWYHHSHNMEWSGNHTSKLIYTSNDDFWTISTRDDGYFVWNSNDTPETDTDDSYIKRDLLDSDASEISSVLYSIAEDKDGSIWIGTDDGVAVYDNPEDVFESNSFYAYRPQITVDGYYKSLLEGENVTSIAVDGANRKWLGTEGGGLFLVSSDGTEQILIFNTSNSPLLSNNIIALELNEENGELFIGTDVGIMSYMTTASEPRTSYSNIYAFPNPVKADYEGVITIRGLMYKTVVKITDLSGELVYQTVSNGGDAIWNGLDLQGNRISSGVYMVLCTNEDGSESEVTKVVIIR